METSVNFSKQQLPKKILKFEQEIPYYCRGHKIGLFRPFPTMQKWILLRLKITEKKCIKIIGGSEFEKIYCQQKSD